MSTCISRHGEFSSHTLDDSYTCGLCGVLDEEALRAELVQARRDAAIAAEHIERGNDETMKAYSQVRALTADVERLCQRLRAGHDGCEAELQLECARDEWRDFERMRPVVKAAQALREAQSASPYLGAPPELVELIAAVDAYEDYTGDERGNAPVESAPAEPCGSCAGTRWEDDEGGPTGSSARHLLGLWAHPAFDPGWRRALAPGPG